MAKWHDVTKEKPPVNEKFSESAELLCIEANNSFPFVGWYNAKHDEWHVMHWKADSLPVRVTHWRELPKMPRVSG